MGELYVSSAVDKQDLSSDHVTNSTENEKILESLEVAPVSGKQYGGIHDGDWVDQLPPSWIPYVQLSRLSPPAGFIIIVFPHLTGVLYAAFVKRSSSLEALQKFLILLGGCFFCNNASHAWNDLIDADIDRQVQRTQLRPVARGSISSRAAFIFSVTQAIPAAAFLLLLPTSATLNAIPTILATLYYPYAKRHINLPQVILGICLSGGIMVGSSSMGIENPWLDVSAVSLYLASVLWVVIFDTIYAHQDLADDVRLGVKSTAVLLAGNARGALWALFSCMLASLLAAGHYANLPPLYYLVSIGSTALAVGRTITYVDLEDSASCWSWFAGGFCFTGATIAGGLLLAFVAQ